MFQNTVCHCSSKPDYLKHECSDKRYGIKNRHSMYFYLFFNRLKHMCYLIKTTETASCPHNEVYYNSTIAPICDVNCQDLQRKCHLSSSRVVAGCYCRPHYARNLQQKCIPRENCGMISE